MKTRTLPCAATPRCVYCVLSTPLVRRFQKKIAQLHAQQQSSNKKDDAPLVFTHNGGGAKQQHLVFSIDSAQLGDVQAQQPPWQPTHESERTFKPWLRWEVPEVMAQAEGGSHHTSPTAGMNPGNNPTMDSYSTGRSSSRMTLQQNSMGSNAPLTPGGGHGE